MRSPNQPLLGAPVAVLGTSTLRTPVVRSCLTMLPEASKPTPMLPQIDVMSAAAVLVPVTKLVTIAV